MMIILSIYLTNLDNILSDYYNQEDNSNRNCDNSEYQKEEKEQRYTNYRNDFSHGKNKPYDNTINSYNKKNHDTTNSFEAKNYNFNSDGEKPSKTPINENHYYDDNTYPNEYKQNSYDIIPSPSYNKKDYNTKKIICC